MKIQVLSDLREEVNRLFIAGGKFATGDMRVARLLPTLQKMGEKAPAIKRLADMTDEMLTSTQPETALAELGVFLGALMDTQGGLCVGELAELESTPYFGILPQTNTPYSTMEPVITALTTASNARLNVIKEALDNGGLNDFRLYNHIAKGLEDKNAEIVGLLAKTIIPSIGPVIVPFLLRDLDIQGGKHDATRFAVLDTLDYEGILQLAHEVLAEGSAAVQPEAVKALGRDAAQEELLLAYTGDKKAAMREAAYIGLARMNSKRGKENLVDVLLSNKPGPGIAAIGHCDDEAVFDAVVKIFESYDEKTNDNMKYLFTINRVLEEHENPAIAADIFRRIAHTSAFNKQHHSFPHTFLTVASRAYSPEQFYDVFMPIYAKHGMVFYNKPPMLDERWADEFIKKQDIFIMGLMMNSSTKDKLLKYLRLYMRKQEFDDMRYFCAAQLLAQHLDADELGFVADGLYKALKKRPKNANQGSIALNGANAYIFNDAALVRKIFAETGRGKLIEKLKEVYSGDGLNYTERTLSDYLQRH